MKKQTWLIAICITVVIFILVVFIINTSIKHNTPVTPALINLKNISSEALEFCEENNFNTDFYILINMNIHSGKERLFVYNFNNDSIVSSGLCSHGCGTASWSSDETKESPVFSNVVNSHCTSEGKYKIGDRGYSNWGINVNYKLHGLENTNDKAFERLIVFHSWDEMPNYEVFPNGAPEGQGCPAVSNELMLEIDDLLQSSSKPVLLWIYN